MSPKSGLIYKRFIKEAATDRIIVAPDYPGFGDSDPPPETPHVTIEDYAASMWKVVEKLALGQGPFDLLGYHTGSMVAAEMAKQTSEKVSNIIMISAPVFTPLELTQKQEAYKPIAIDEAGTRFKTMWEMVMLHRPKDVPLKIAAESFVQNLKPGDRYFWGHRAAFAYATKFVKVVEGLKQHIAVLNPMDDLYTETQRIEPHLKNGEIVDLPNWGHGFLDIHSKAAVKIIKGLLR